MLDPDRELADPPAGGIEHRVGDRGPDPDRADLSYPAGADRARVGIELLRERRLHRRDVRMDRKVVAAVPLGHEPPGDRIDPRLLVERLADSPDEPADDLAPGGDGVDDPAGAVDAEAAGDPGNRDPGIDPDLDESGAPRRQLEVETTQWRRIASAIAFALEG